MEAIILAGGFGTRLRSVCNDRPKPMAPIHGKPFLHYLINYWANQGIDHFILSVGYMHELIINYFSNCYQNISIDYAIEKEALGTGGALLHSLPYLKEQNQPFLVLNGDTFFTIPLKKFSLLGNCHLALYKVKKNKRYGGVSINKKKEIQMLKHQISPLINGGCYLFKPKALSSFKEKILSLENEIIPYFIKKKSCYGTVFQKPFIDIGIPEDYNRSQTFIQNKTKSL